MITIYQQESYLTLTIIVSQPFNTIHRYNSTVQRMFDYFEPLRCSDDAIFTNCKSNKYNWDISWN